MYPLASAIDTPLPAPKKRKHYMLEHKPAWVQVQLRRLVSMYISVLSIPVC